MPSNEATRDRVCGIAGTLSIGPPAEGDQRLAEEVDVDLHPEARPVGGRPEAAARARLVACDMLVVQSFMNETVNSVSRGVLAARWATAAMTRSPPQAPQAEADP